MSGKQQIYMMSGIILIVGGVFTLWGLSTLWVGTQALYWAQTDGTVVTSEVVRSAGSDIGVLYSPHVVYRYTVDGITYEKPLEWGGTSLRWHVQRLANQFPQGGTATVYYPANRPERGMILRFPWTTIVIPVAFGSAMLAVGVGLLRGLHDKRTAT